MSQIDIDKLEKRLNDTSENFILDSFKYCDPEKTAVEHEEVIVTFGELFLHLNSVIEELENLGVKKGDVITIESGRSLNWYVYFLASLALDLTYVPIDADFPSERKELIRIQSRALWSVIIAEDGVEISQNSMLENTADSLEQSSYIIFTSGSTGTPKGAMVHKLGMINHLLAKVETLSINENDVVALTAPISFDISIWQSLIGLVCGVRTVIFSNLSINSPRHFLQKTSRKEVTIVEVVPSYLERLLRVRTCSEMMGKLRYLLVTGENLPHSLVRDWFKEVSGVPLINAYGPTEASDDITQYVLSEPRSDGNVPIGYPLRNIELHIDGTSYQDCVHGTTGELWVSGISVGNGYINNESQTKESFWTVNGKKFYKTGDLVEVLKDRAIKFISRVDNQVKVAGNRIELGEIDNVLCKCDCVSLVVSIYEKEKGITCAFIGDAEPEKLRVYAQENLPSYMVPRLFKKLENLPLNQNGKIDRTMVLKLLA